MQNKKIVIITLFFSVLALAGAGCAKSELLNNNGNGNNPELNVNNAVNLFNANSAAVPSNSNESAVNSGINANSGSQTVSEAQIKSNVEKIARFFTEYFGSFSTDADYGNITGLKVYMTQSMQKWADGFVAEARKTKNPAGGYFGVTTKAVSVKTDSFSNEQGKAEVLVSTQRRESTGTSTNSRIYYQDMSVGFVKEKGVWKVNEAKWR